MRASLSDVRSAVTRVDARVTRQTGYTLQLTLEEGGARRERVLQGASCDELVEAMIWLLVVAGGAPEPAPSPHEADHPRRSPYLSLAAGVWSNSLPAPQALMVGAVGYALGAFELELRYGHAFARERAFASSGRVALRSDSLAVAGCWALRRGRFATGPCMVITGTRAAADVRGITDPVSASALGLLGGLSVRGQVALRARWALLAEAGAGLPLVARPRFSVEGDGVVARASLVSAYGLFGLVASW